MGTSPGRKKTGEGGVSVEYGTVKALHAIAERIGLIDIVNQAAPKRNGLLVGESWRSSWPPTRSCSLAWPPRGSDRVTGITISSMDAEKKRRRPSQKSLSPRVSARRRLGTAATIPTRLKRLSGRVQV